MSNVIEKSVHGLLDSLYEEGLINLSDSNFIGTAGRVERAYKEILSGEKNTQQQISEVLSSTFPSPGYRNIIFCSNILTFGLCPHHLLPVEFHTTVGYIPSDGGGVIGASKLARVVDILSRRAVLQETLTQDIADALETAEPDGVAVVVSGTHFCMRMRGIRQQSTFETSVMRGAFFNKQSTRQEFFDLMREAGRK